ncbi:MAG: primosomal protein N' [Bacteroidaceae bacterium]|nr:primosomal protein N' [Bacteroidaceae bacterium]
MTASVILPLPLEGTFTYSVPASLSDKVKPGCRVLVPWGKTKKYIAVIDSVQTNQPIESVPSDGKQFTVKEIEQLIDTVPIVTEAQLKLWHWISDYYLSPIGEVMNAALPAGLKQEDRYKPKTETCIKLNPKLAGERNLHIALNVLKRAQKQAEMFCCFLELSGWDKLSSNEVTVPETSASDSATVPEASPSDIFEVTRDELLNSSHGNTATLHQLIKRDFIIEYEREIGRLNNLSLQPYKKFNTLNETQQEAYNKILLQLMKKNTVLLHGVTSSGKTEIYIHLIQRAIERHEQVLYLMPEIALTFQMRQRLQAVFGNKLGIYHSKYSDEERVEIWQKQLSPTPYSVILGARSAAFLPFQNLGLVIIDEEHETSFKQADPAPRYHARSVAIMLAHWAGAKTLLGTATPSAETYFNAAQDNPKYGLVELTQRYKGIEMPEIKVIDIQDYRRRKMMSASFSPDLLDAMKTALANGEQVILFQNRRGFSQMVECKTCGWTPRCERCDVSLSYHKTTNQLTCHYCGYTFQLPTRCPNCQGNDFGHKGQGTEKIEEQILQYIPDAKVSRMDLDTTRTRTAHERIIDDFAKGHTNILIGTQMITKGLDFKNVSVVGIINADTLLNFPDFRAYEHAFMMLSQVAGRAGRHGKRGTVYLQTTQKQLPVIRQIVENDFSGFFHDLMIERQMFKYPPFSHVIYVFIKHKNISVVETASIEMTYRLKSKLQNRVLGPETPFVSMVKSMNIRRIMIKIENGLNMQSVRQFLRYCQTELMKDKRYTSLMMYYDVDPL